MPAQRLDPGRVHPVHAQPDPDLHTTEFAAAASLVAIAIAEPAAALAPVATAAVTQPAAATAVATAAVA